MIADNRFKDDIPKVLYYLRNLEDAADVQEAVNAALQSQGLYNGATYQVPGKTYPARYVAINAKFVISPLIADIELQTATSAVVAGSYFSRL